MGVAKAVRLGMFGFWLGIVGTVSVSAESLMDVYDISLRHDPRYYAALHAYEASQEATPQSRAGLLPSLALDYIHTETSQDIKSSDNFVFGRGRTDFPTDELTLSLVQPIFRYESWVALRQAKSSVRQAAAVFAAEEQALILRVAELYLGVLAARDNLTSARAEQDAIARQLALAEGRLRNGMATRTDVYDASARLAVAQADEAEAANLLDDANYALRESTGVLVNEFQTLAEDIALKTPSPEAPGDWVSNALENNFALLARTEAHAIARDEVKRQRAGHMPSVELRARINDRDTEGTLFGGGSDVETTDYAVVVSVPLYSGGATSSRVREAGSLLRRAEQDLKLERLVVARETKAAFLGVMSAIRRVEALAQSAKAQSEALSAKRKGFRSGLHTSLEVLDAERDFYLTQRDYARARYDYLLNTLRLKQAVGTLTPSDLEAVDAMLR